MAMDLEVIASVLGVSVPVTRFLLCFVGSIPVSALARFVPAGSARNLYAAVTGMVLSYYSFGWEANLFFILPIVVGYGSMILARWHCGLITFVVAFAFLLTCHVLMMSGDAWKNGGIDTTGALMVLTLKVISASFSYGDGLIKKEESLRVSQKKNRLMKPPSLVQYLGYCLNCGTHLAGPVYEIKDYIDWTEDKGLWSRDAARPPPSPLGAALRAFVQAVICMVVYMFLLPRVPLSKFDSLEYEKWGFWHRLWYMYLSGFTARWKYYFIWSISEVAVIISGLGFSGWKVSDDKDVQATWTRAENVDILKVEFAKSGVEIPKYWNQSTGTWLRHYVYERLPKEFSGFPQLLITQLVSAVWHGLYAGYILYFIHSALMIFASRVIYKWQSSLSEKAVWARRLGHLINGLFGALVNNYGCIGFLLLSFSETMQAYSSVNYVGTIVPVAIIVLGLVVKPPRSTTRVNNKKVQ